MTTTSTTKKNQSAIYTPSVNIIRDINKELRYIPTPNAQKVFDQLISDYKNGIRSFNIVGAYGTGKSAFLWAFEKDINCERSYFASKHFKKKQGFERINIIGDFASLIDTMASQFNVKKGNNFRIADIIKKISEIYEKAAGEGNGLILVIDEFGKFLEYAAQHNPEKELYFIQQLAEYVNDAEKNIFFITTLHQDFNGYSRNLTKAQQNEWDKVKGRLKELTFNEPVEQLLFLASERLRDIAEEKKNKDFGKLFKAIEKAKAFPLRDYFSEQFAEKLLPFDILSIAILTLALQKYGQNERSLFSFMESSDHQGLKDFDSSKNAYYDVSRVYDYLIHNYYSLLSTKYNPHYAQWSAIRIAIESSEGVLEDYSIDGIKIIKTIGLLNIFANASIQMDISFLSAYSIYALSITNPEPIIKKLEGLRIIRFVKHLNKYILFEGTDLDIELAIDEAGNLIEKVTNVVYYLNQHFDFPYISAKAVFYNVGTPRFFSFKLSESPFISAPSGEIDGFVNLIFSETLKREELVQASQACNEAILFGWYKNTNEIKNLLFEIEKIKRVKEDHLEDRVAIRELDSILQHQVKLLNHFVIGNIYSSHSSIEWYYGGRRINISDQRTFNRFLSTICEEVYYKTPVYRNEMVNKSKLSSPIVTARRNFIAALADNFRSKDLSFEENKFPPEKTIYLSLLRETGIHRRDALDNFTLASPFVNDTGFAQLWEDCELFLESSKHSKRNIMELVDILQVRPYKLKQGFIDFWLAIFLFSKRDDFALFSNDVYIPFLTQETLELVLRNPKEYEVKQFNIEGVNLDLFNSYRALLNQSTKDKPNAENFIETIRPFLTFYRQLPEYAKNTNRLNKKTLALRSAIANAKDPEDTFFNKFPKALGYDIAVLQNDASKLPAYVALLQNGIREIRSSYDELINRVEIFMEEELVGAKNYPAYKIQLQKRFNGIKKHLLLSYQKAFYQRVYSEIDDNKAWLNSIVQACVGKSLESISDEDEHIFYDKIKDIVHELDNLGDISKSGFDEKKEIVFKLEVTSFVEGLKKNLVRLPISKNKELIQQQSMIKAKLGADRQLNIATLAKLLEELLSNEKS